MQNLEPIIETFAIPLMALICILIGMWVGVRILRMWNRYWTQRRFARGRAGEESAEKFLRNRGYSIISTQEAKVVEMTVDGDAVPVTVIADFILSKEGKHFVAEVKTGMKAVEPDYTPTRRQLLEYAFAFRPDGLILVDMEAKKEMAIGFPYAGITYSTGRVRALTPARTVGVFSFALAMACYWWG